MNYAKNLGMSEMTSFLH